MIIGLVILVAAILIMMRQTFSRGVPPMVSPVQVAPAAPFKISSSALTPDMMLPARYTCSETALNPPLSIENVPENTKELVLILHDLDGESGKITNWVVWNIYPQTVTILERTVPYGAIVGTNDSGNTNYIAPCVPAEASKEHRFTFDLYAIDEVLSLEATSTKDRVIAAMNGRVIAKTQFTINVPPQKIIAP